MEKVIKDNWVRCPNCGHKLFKNVELGRIDGIEIKCHSCKEIVLIEKRRCNELTEGGEKCLKK